MSRSERGSAVRWAAVVAALAASVTAIAGAALAKPPGGTPGLASTYFARVGFDGTQAVLVEGKGIDSVYGGPAYSGRFFVTFTEPVDQCAWTASINPFFGGPPSGWGEIVVGPDWDNTVEPPENQTPDPNVLRVLMTDGNGDPATFREETPEPQPVLQTFTVVANC